MYEKYNSTDFFQKLSDITGKYYINKKYILKDCNLLKEEHLPHIFDQDHQLYINQYVYSILEACKCNCFCQ